MASLAPPGADKSHPSAAAPKKTTLALGNLPAKQQGFGQQQYPRTPSRVDPNNPPWPAYRGYHEYSFAHATMGVRLPTILGKAIDDVVKTLNEEHDEERIVDLTACISRMEDLLVHLQNNAKLRPIIDDGEGDIPLWNKEIARYFRNSTFMDAPWLFAEAYKYRRLHECFSLSRYWKDYDVFMRQKCETFSRSSDAVFELSLRFAEPVKQVDGATPEQQLEAKRLMFHELTQVCLWGNATDLSLLIDMSEEDIKRLQSTGGDHLAATEKNILGNHLPQVWEYVSSDKFRSKPNGGRFDIVMDNAGFELYCDMVYADFLIQSGLCREVRFHGKRFAWFVSDVTRADMEWLPNMMVYGHLFPDATDDQIQSLRTMGQRWKEYLKNGTWIYEEHAFWCTGYTYWDLKKEAPDLFLHLSHSDLVLFKGDLNHRKLTCDCHAPSSTPFDVAIGPLASEAGAPPVFSLRTVKADVVVGIPVNADGTTRADELDKEQPGWRTSGSYAVALLSMGRKGEPVVFA